jgi:hypothetical protein
MTIAQNRSVMAAGPDQFALLSDTATLVAAGGGDWRSVFAELEKALAEELTGSTRTGRGTSGVMLREKCSLP